MKARVPAEGLYGHKLNNVLDYLAACLSAHFSDEWRMHKQMLTPLLIEWLGLGL